MSELPVPQKPIPQYTLRWLLGAMVVCAMFSSVVALAIQGHVWALAISVGVAAAVTVFVTGAVLFLAVWAFSSLAIRPGRRRGRSPFGVAVAGAAPAAPPPPSGSPLP